MGRQRCICTQLFLFPSACVSDRCWPLLSSCASLWPRGLRCSSQLPPDSILLLVPAAGTSVMQVMASDADDPTYGSSARVVYSVLEGEQHFTVDSKTGKQRPAGLGCREGRPWPPVPRRFGARLCAHGPAPLCWGAGAAGVPEGWRGSLRALRAAAWLRAGPERAAPWSRSCSCQPRAPRLCLCWPELPCARSRSAPAGVKPQCERFKYYQRGLPKGCVVITRALIKGNTLN